jgi:3-hydroxyacyl-[acyl-carrier-protein] dehydratase
MEHSQKILAALPYGKDFCFVDTIETVDEERISGTVTFREDSFFYKAHFTDKPMVPGVIMIEAMGQLGMVCHLIYLSGSYDRSFLPVLSNVEATFVGNAEYGELCYVHGKKLYFRRNILKSEVELKKEDGTPIARLTANIMMIPKK